MKNVTAEGTIISKGSNAMGLGGVGGCLVGSGLYMNKYDMESRFIISGCEVNAMYIENASLCRHSLYVYFYGII
ncbi:hypothetical protein ACSVC9_08760 [Clostridium sp. LBM24168]